MYGGCCRGHCSDGGEFGSALLLSLLVLLNVGLKQLAMGEKGLLCEMRLVFEPDPFPGLVVSHCMLQDHEL